LKPQALILIVTASQKLGLKVFAMERLVYGNNSLIHKHSSRKTFKGLLASLRRWSENQPCFEEIANQLKQELEGKIFVAHNARFDYGFIKASFKRIGIDFKPKVLCTVKLSRLLFPSQSRHNLDTIIQAQGLKVSARHRALRRR
jgi:DNA polymerase III epsilon subunit-like protein